jgi:O-methyltransferase involved in polyketide biosynthesis
MNKNRVPTGFGPRQNHKWLISLNSTGKNGPFWPIFHLQKSNGSQSGYDYSQKTLFIWEGVSMYITPEAVDQTLSFVVTNSIKGSGIIFNYCFQSLVDGTCTLFGAEKFRKYVMKKEEPILFGIEEGKTESFLKSRGFSHVKDATGKELQKLYFKNSNIDRRLPEFGGIAYATV